jgi:UDP-N-acetylglucosamine 2-epimerase (non-hydrolysing)
MVGTKLWIPVAYLEAGLQSRDRQMPEEINRLVRAENLTDNLAEVLAGKWPAGNRPDLWDGQTAQRAVDDLLIRARA